MEQGDLTRAHCNVCSGDRNHFILFREEKKWSEGLDQEGYAYIWGDDAYDLLRCAGCGKITFRHTSRFSENTDENGRQIPMISYYPPATFRREPKWLSGTGLSAGGDVFLVWLPDFVTRLLREIYVALHGDCSSLAVMGIRALLERVMIDRVGDKGSFSENLAAFQMQGHIGQVQKDILDATLEVGHASIHRDYNPSRQDLEHALDIAENVIEALYISPAQAEALKKRIPPRAKPA